MKTQTQTQTQTLSKIFASKFDAVCVVKTINTLIDQTCRGWTDDETVRASDLRLSVEDSKALSSSSFSAQTFIKGVAHRLALFAHGQTLDRVQEGLTVQAQYALVAASAPLKRGAGLSVAQLRDCLNIGMQKLLALPIKESTKAPKLTTTTTTTTTATTDTTTDTTATDDAAHKRSEAIMALRRVQALHEQAGILADAAKHETQLRILENARKSAYGAASVAASSQPLTNRQAAIELCRLADQLGVKLTKAQLSLIEKAEKAA